MDIPSKWVAMVVKYGEKDKFLYWSSEDGAPTFFKTEAEAQKWAEDNCRYDQQALVLVLRADRMVKAKPVEFDNIKAA